MSGHQPTWRDGEVRLRLLSYQAVYTSGVVRGPVRDSERVEWSQEADMATRGIRFLASDIWEAPDNDKKYEVIDGELYVTPPPDWIHQEQLSNLDYFVKNWVKAHRLGRIVNAPVGVVLDDENGLEPDLLFISHERAYIIQKRGVF